MDNPCTSWLPETSWDNITELDKLVNFRGIMASFEEYPRDWNLWFSSAEPENTTLPGTKQLVHVLDMFQVSPEVVFDLCVYTLYYNPVMMNMRFLTTFLLMVVSLRSNPVQNC